MTEESLYQAVVEAISEEIARKVSEKLLELQKKALVVCTGSTMGFSNWLVSLQQLQQAGFQFDLYLSQSAVQIVDVATLRGAVQFGKVWSGDSEQPPELVAAPYPTIIVPAMTVNTAAKIAGCTADTPAARVVFNSMMRGKNVIIAIDGCCPDNEARAAKGYKIPEPLKAQLRANMARMREFGAALTTAEKLASKTLRVIGAGSAPREEAQAPCVAAASKAAAPGAQRLEQRIIGRKDVANLPAGTVLRVPRECQITQLAADIARTRGVTLVRE